MERRWWTALLAVVSACLVGNATWHLLAVAGATDPTHHLVDLAMIGGSTAGGLAVAVWHARRGPDREHQRRTLGWLVTSVVLFVAVATVTLYAGSARVTDAELFEAVQLSASVGVFVGLLVGRVESRALENARAAASARAEAAALDAERERFDHVSGLLRHYVNNVVTVIGGHTEHLASGADDDERSRLGEIDRHTRTIVTLVEHVSELSAAERADVTTAAVPLEAVLDSAVADLRTDPEVTIKTPGAGPAVQTSETVEAALSLVCEVLVSLGDDATVTVRYEPGASDGGDQERDADFTGDDVRLVVETPGGELPAAVEQAPFEAHGTGIGLRFYLARELLGEDGALTLGDDDEDGTDDEDGDGVRVVVVLRRADAG